MFVALSYVNLVLFLPITQGLNYTTSVVRQLAAFSLRVTRFTRITGPTEYVLDSGFNLLRHIYVGFNNMSFCERLS